MPELNVGELTRWDGTTCLVSSAYFLLYLALHWLVGSSFWALVLPLIAWGGWEGWRWRKVGAEAAVEGEVGQEDELSRREKAEEEREERRRQSIEREEETLRGLVRGLLLPSRRRAQVEGEELMQVQADGEEEEERKDADGARLSLELTTPHATHTLLVRGLKASHSAHVLAVPDGPKVRPSDGHESRSEKKLASPPELPATAVS